MSFAAQLKAHTESWLEYCVDTFDFSSYVKCDKFYMHSDQSNVQSAAGKKKLQGGEDSVSVDQTSATNSSISHSFLWEEISWLASTLWPYLRFFSTMKLLHHGNLCPKANLQVRSRRSDQNVNSPTTDQSHYWTCTKVKVYNKVTNNQDQSMSLNNYIMSNKIL